MNTKFTILATQILISTRGMEVGGKVQRYIDSEVLRLTDPYIPSDSTDLRKSATRHTKIGSGEVIWKTPYARKQYETNKGNGLRGKQWFHRSKADNRSSILNGACKVAGSRGGK